MARGSARPLTTAMVCGWQSSETKKTLASSRSASPASICMASAAAVASSSSEAPATSRPVRSMTMVWKLSSASSRPWAISAW
jgi:hypothetical protein